jgi:hypothetical protein
MVNDDNSVRLWRFESAMPESCDHILSWAKVLTGLATDSGKSPTVIRGEPAMSSRVRLASHGGRPASYVEALRRRRAANEDRGSQN